MALPGPTWALFLVGFGLLELVAPEVVLVVEEATGLRSRYARRPGGRYRLLRRVVGLVSILVGLLALR